MLIKTSTQLTSALSAVFHNQKGQRQAIFLMTAVTLLILWKLHAGISPANPANDRDTPSETATNDQRIAGMKWSYDELAHKLIIENTDLAYAEIDERFTKGIGRALNKVTRQGIDRNNAGKRVLANL